MKKNKIWFSIIEIIIVVSIMTIIWFFWVSRFNSLLWEQNLELELANFNNFIESLDDSLWKNNTDYSLFLYTWSNFYHYYTNLQYKKWNVNIYINSYTWKLKLNTDLTWNWQNLIYFNNKLIKTDFIASSWSIDLNIYNKWKYKVSWNIGDDYFNDVYVDYFSDLDRESNIKLIDIIYNTTSHTWIIIKNNLSWKKRYYNILGDEILDEISLKFESNWIEKTLKLN